MCNPTAGTYFIQFFSMFYTEKISDVSTGKKKKGCVIRSISKNKGLYHKREGKDLDGEEGREKLHRGDNGISGGSRGHLLMKGAHSPVRWGETMDCVGLRQYGAYFISPLGLAV